MPKINTYQDISQIDREAKKDFIDRHSPFIHVADTAKAGEKLAVKVVMGEEYVHPDDFDHYIKYIQLWNGEVLLAETNFPPGTLGNKAGHAEVDFHIVPSKGLKLVAMAYCTKHGLWQSDPKEVAITE
jgi:superoxide reductase